jgi:hypothetical protein
MGDVSATGALDCGTASIIIAVNDGQAASKTQNEADRHNREVERQPKGSGLF